MSERVTMPALGESVTEGTVTRWLKSVGDEVAVDEPLLEVSTDKVDTEIPSPVAGTLQEILVEEDETVPVGAELAVIGDGEVSDSSDSGAAEGESEATPDQSAAASGDAAAAEGKEEASEETAKEDGADAAAADSSSDGSSDPSSAGSAGGDVQGGETITMPALGESVTEGTITRWLKSEGDEVAVDEPLLEVSTDKVDTEVPSPVAGTLTKILVQEDETVPVGAELAIVGGEAGGSKQAPKQDDAAPKDEQKSEETSEEPAAKEKSGDLQDKATAAAENKQESPEPEAAPGKEGEKQEQEQDAAQQQEQAPKEDKKPESTDAKPASTAGEAGYVTPLVRKLAEEAGVDLSSVKGTGVGGRIRKQDIQAAAEAAKALKQQEAPAAPAADAAPAASGGGQAAPAAVSPKRGTTEKMSRMRKLIATRMVESLQVSAQLTTVVEVDVTKIARLRDKAKAGFQQREGVKLSFMPFFALAAVEALKAYPQLNASVQDDSIVYHPSENLGIAVDTEKGLFVPVIANAGDLNIAGLSRKIADLADRTRTNKITPDELGGGTFTLTNTGSRGALFDTPIINQPQVGILGTGSVVKRAVVVTDADGGESIAIRSMVYLALSYDHRIVDGADAARFLTHIKTRLEEGAFEV